VDNTSDAAKPVSTATQTALNLKSNTGHGHTFGDISGQVSTAQLPPLAINETFSVATQAAMLALTAQRGDMAIRSDNGRTYVLATDAATNLADWKEVMAAGQVQSVAGKTGVVALVKADVGLGSVDNTADTAKPVSTAQQTALNLKQDTSAKGAASGYAPLDSSSRVPVANFTTCAGNKAARDALTTRPVGFEFMRTDRDNHIQAWNGTAWKWVSTPERFYADSSVFSTTGSASAQLIGSIGTTIMPARAYATQVRVSGGLTMIAPALTAGQFRSARLAVSVVQASVSTAQGKYIATWTNPGNYYQSGRAETDWIAVNASADPLCRIWLEPFQGTAVTVGATNGAGENFLYAELLPADD
jgi:hypothetical protein